MEKQLEDFFNFIRKNDGISSKESLIEKSKKLFNFSEDRKIYHNDYFSVRFSSSESNSFPNTIVAISKLKKYDDKPFFSCLVTPKKNILYLANSTFIKKVSHSSKKLRIDNLRGSINGTDILRDIDGISNETENFDQLFSKHEKLGFSKNIDRIVEETNNIKPNLEKYKPKSKEISIIKKSPKRAKEFIKTKEFRMLKNFIDESVTKHKKVILQAFKDPNTNFRGRRIEYLITGEDDIKKEEIIEQILKKK